MYAPKQFREERRDVLLSAIGNIRGMSYAVLYMPPHVTRYSLPALRKLRDLVAAGGIVVGPKPVGGVGVADGDSEVRKIANELWGDKLGPGRRFVTGASAGIGRAIAIGAARHGADVAINYARDSAGAASAVAKRAAERGGRL